jgi:hypothetical protein
MKKSKIFFAAIFACFVFVGQAQQADNSPYSRYGIGIVNEKSFNHLRQMGGLGASYVDGYHINIVNPASFAFLNSTAFDIGFFGKHTTLTDSKNKNSFWTGNLEYISLGFPLKNPINEVYDGKVLKHKYGMNFTLISNSTVDYNIRVLDSLDGIGSFNRNYVGKGGTYKFQWGNAYRYKDLSFGLNLGYLFGKVTKETSVIYEQDRFSYNSINKTIFNLRGFSWDAGVMYMKSLNAGEVEKNKSIKLRRLSVGAHFKMNDRFSTTGSQIENLVQNLPPNIFNIDTVRIVPNQTGKGKLPGEVGLGATYYVGEKAAIGINYTSSFWSNYYNEVASEVAGTLKNSSKVSIGGYYRPNYKSIDNFLERMYYRYGAFYGTDPLALNGDQIKNYGLSVGFGIPVVYQRKISNVNLGATFGSRGAGTAVSEKYIKLSLGVTFNDDEWFLKKKYN